MKKALDCVSDYQIESACGDHRMCERVIL